MSAHDTTATAAIGRTRNPRVFLDLVGPAVRGLVLERGKQGPTTTVPTRNDAQFVWDYERNRADLAKLYEAAKRSQWNGSTDLDWSIDVDPHRPGRELVPDSWLPLADVPQYRTLPRHEQEVHRWALVSWILSQFLHGEQGALYAACQVTEAIGWMDGKLYRIDDNLYTILDALMTDGRWDLKFLGMQVMVEGLALGAFGTLRQATREPLLHKLLEYVITDEARHVTFGVVALRDYYSQLPEPERREREDWAYEIAVLMRNRFLGHEFYDEYYGHVMSKRAWDEIVLGSGFMRRFRHTMFRRLIPNLRRIHLLSDRVRKHYERLGLLAYEHGRAAPELTERQLLDEDDVPP